MYARTFLHALIRCRDWFAWNTQMITSNTSGKEHPSVHRDENKLQCPVLPASFLTPFLCHRSVKTVHVSSVTNWSHSLIQHAYMPDLPVTQPHIVLPFITYKTEPIKMAGVFTEWMTNLLLLNNQACCCMFITGFYCLLYVRYVLTWCAFKSSQTPASF